MCMSFSLVVVVVWFTGQNDTMATWLRYLEYGELNETLLRREFDSLKSELNATYTIENKTVEEIFMYVQAMRELVPVNPHKFNWLINPRNICQGRDIFLLTYVHSAPAHYKRRTAIRETWGNPKNFPDFTFRLVFLLGRPGDKTMQEAVQLESDMYGDIVQEDFADSYRNLTYKAIMGLKWITNHCPQARYILKTDDDIFVNIFNVAKHILSIHNHEKDVKKMLLCLVWYRMKVVRDPKSKWYLSKSEFRDDFFPTYCSGSAYIMTADLIPPMYNASMFTPFFWVDDFYVTGLLAKKVGAAHRKFNSVYILGPSVFLQKFTEEAKWRTLVFGHVHNLNNMVHVWNKVVIDHNNGSVGDVAPLVR